MNYQQLKKLQKDYGVDSLQESINSGIIWKMNGSSGRFAMDCLEIGIVMLPKHSNQDYYGNTVPSRDVLKQGTKGTYQNAVKFWTNVLNGEDNAHELLENYF